MHAGCRGMLFIVACFHALRFWVSAALDIWDSLGIGFIEDK